MSIERSWCPQCRKWVPAKLMNYDYDDNGRLLRVCTPCLEGKEISYIEEPEHETVRCVWCDSTNVKELAPEWNKYWCNDCNETFRRI